MNEQINILSFQSAEDIATELVGRFKKSGQDVLFTILGELSPLTIEIMQKGAFITALIVTQEDMDTVSSIDWISSPKLNIVGKDNGICVLFCVNCKDIPHVLFDFFVVREVRDSAEIIRTELMQLYHQLFQKIKGRYGDFVGRNNEIEQFQNIYYSEKASYTNVLVVSGRPGVGREAFVRECIHQAKGQKDYEPYMLSIGKNCNIELFLVQLNSICRKYFEQELKKLLGSETGEKIKAAVDMLNELFEEDKYLILYDDGVSCVRYNRLLSDWFKSIVTNPMLIGGMHLYVISNISVSYSRIMTDDDVAYITLYGMTMSDRKKLLYKLLSSATEAVTEDNVHFLAEKLVYSPSQLIKVAEDIKNKGIKQVKNNIDGYQTVGDKKISNLIRSYDVPEHPEAKNLLVLFSRIEYVGKKILSSIYNDRMPEIEKEIDQFMADGIVERFGEWLDLMRLDGSVCDYIRRNKIGYSEKAIQLEVTDALAKLIEGQQMITEDFSIYLYKIKKGVEQGRFEEESYLVPSVLINAISEAYDNRDWGMTIKLCEDVMSKQPNYFQEVYREIRYWYCLALARERNADEFYNQVQYFGGADIHFLKGFFLRIKKEYAKAESEYQKALEISPGFSKAKHEMVLVLQAQHKFSSALEMAKDNYEKDPENAYHIHAYFRCLVRKKDITYDERVLLKSFISDDNNLFKSKYYIEGMRFEYSRFVDRANPDILLPKATELKQKFPEAKYINDVVTDYLVSQGVASHLHPVDYSDDFNY